MANLTYKGYNNASENTGGNSLISSSAYSYSGFFAQHAIVYNNAVVVFRATYADTLTSSGWGTSTIFTDGLGGGESSCVFKNKLYIAGSRSSSQTASTVYYNTDLGSGVPGSTWTAATTRFTDSTRLNTRIAAGSELIVCVSGTSESLSGSPQLQISSEGDSFLDITSNLVGQTAISVPLTGVAYGNGQFVISTLDGRVVRCNDSFPLIFTNIVTLNSYSLGAKLSVKFDSYTNKFYAYGRADTVNGKRINIFSSSDAITWTDISINLATVNNVFAVYVIGNTLYANADTKIYASTDSGLTWSLVVENLASQNFAAVNVSRNIAYVAYGGSGGGTIYKQQSVDLYGTNPSIPSTTSANNAPLKGGEFESNLKSLDTQKLDSSQRPIGSILYAGSDGVMTPSLIGATSQILTSAGVLPVWAASQQKTPVDIQLFSTPGTTTWIKPSGAKLVHIVLIGGGGGGQSGMVGSYSVVSPSGGSAAGRTEIILKATSLPSTISVAVGIGGTGGTSTNTALANGANGGDSLFGNYAAQGGIGGNAGFAFLGTLVNWSTSYIGPGFCQHAFITNGSNSGFSAWFNPFSYENVLLGYSSKVASYNTNNAAYTLSNMLGGGNSYVAPGGGGGGGSYCPGENTIGKWTAGTNGGLGGLALTQPSDAGNFSKRGNGGLAGTSEGQNGFTSTSDAQLNNLFVGGNGGGGGASSQTSGVAAGNGGDGYRGGGGGGGGSCVTGTIAGKGGNGGNGQVLVITYF